VSVPASAATSSFTVDGVRREERRREARKRELVRCSKNKCFL
jgi:hypothetical protein